MGGGGDLVPEKSTDSRQQKMPTLTANRNNQKGSSALFSRSSVPPLAPLEYLQNQQRGSITDPSLHAAAHINNASGSSNSNTPRPSYASQDVVGHDTTEQPPTSKTRKHGSTSAKGSRHRGTQDHNRSRVGLAECSEPDEMDVDEKETESKHSSGSKRKMSSDRVGKSTDGPASKRRGSTVDAQQMGQMSLYSRSAAVGSGGGGTGAGDAETKGAVPGSMAFAWPAPEPPPEQAMASMQNEAHDPSVPSHLRPLDPNDPHPQLSIMSSIAFPNDRRISDNLSSGEPSSGPSRALRSRSRPPSRQLRGADQTNASGPSSGDNTEEQSSAPSPGAHKGQRDSGVTPYSRSPELRVSHKLAERKRRKEMKDLFDELRDQLPADRGMKASKWEILSKAIDFVVQLKQSHQDMAREIDMLRHELDGVRGGVTPFGPGGPPHPVVYGQPPLVTQQYPSGTMPQPPSHPLSRPPSSQNAFPPGAGPAQQQQQGQQAQQHPPAQNGNRTDAPQS